MDKPAKGMTLAAKLCAIMAECKNIPKNGYNAFHKYKYVKAEDVADYVREAMVRYKVIALPEVLKAETQKTDKGFLTEVVMGYTFIDAENPSDREKVSMLGHGYDATDKAAYKANTGVHKYFMLQSFNLAGTDEPERDDDDKGDHAAAAPKPAPQRSAAPVVADKLPPKEPVKPSADGLWYYNVPFKEKDDWNPVLKRNKARWNPDNKHWESRIRITGMDRYLTQSQRAPIEQAEADERADRIMEEAIYAGAFDDDDVPF